MARDGLSLIVCAAMLFGWLGGAGSVNAAPPDDRATTVAHVLAVQIALQQGRDYLLHKDPRAAVDVLEGQLPYVDGNMTYLALLRDAYRSRIQELQLANQHAAAQVYVQRLAILDPGASIQAPTKPAPVVKEARGAFNLTAPQVEKESLPVPGSVKLAVTPPAKVETPAPQPKPTVIASATIATPAPIATLAQTPAPKPQPPASPPTIVASAVPAVVAAPARSQAAPTTPAVPHVNTGIVARGKIPEEDDYDPMRPLPGERQKQARAFVTEAEQAFAQRRYRDAGQFFTKAYGFDQASVSASHDRWAYCMLDHVVDELNHPKFGSPPIGDLEAEVRMALQLAPHMEYGKVLLAEIDKRRPAREAESAKSKSAPAVVVHHAAQRNGAGWYVAESTNFRIYHNQARDYVEAVARIAERTRVDMQKKWFGATGRDWNPRCEIFLYATADEYSQATNTPAVSPGHSSFSTNEKDGRLLGRRMDLHCDNVNMLHYVLPHETTHTVLAGNFGERPIPRWADEGMAVLTEPNDKIEGHLRNLSQHRANRELFSTRDLLQMSEYPQESNLVGSFYAESVSVVDYLVRLKGAPTFTQFVREGMYSGYEAALQRHYGFRSFAEFEEHWAQYALDGGRARSLAKE